MRAVRIEGLDIRPKPKFVSLKAEPSSMDYVVCPSCFKEEAKWDIEGAASCSICFIYERLANQKAEVDNLISEIEKVMSRKLRRDSNDRLENVDDADRVAVGIVMAQRFEQSRKLSR